MEAWQTHRDLCRRAGAGFGRREGNKEILGRMDMIVAAGGGERDLAVDSTILNLKRKVTPRPAFSTNG